MADCNTCSQYMSVEDILRRSIKCDANGNVALNGGLLNYSTIDGEAFDNGKIILQFDDAWKSVYQNGLALFQEQSVYPDLMANAAPINTGGVQLRGFEMMTWAELLTMKQAGCDVQCHGYRASNISTLTDEQLIENYTLNNSNFTTNGLVSPLHTVYNAGDITDHAIKVIDNYRLTGRRGSTGFNTRKTNLYNLKGFAFSDTTNIDTIKKWMDEAKLNKTAVCLYGHMIGVSDVLSTSVIKIRAIIEYAKQIGLEFISQAELYKLMFYLDISTSRDCPENQIDILIHSKLNIPIYLERSTDNGATWTEIHVLDAGETMYSDTELALNTNYLYRAKGANLPYSTVVSDFTNLVLNLAPTGYGTGVSTLMMQSIEAVTLTLSEGAKFYTDAAGTLNESSTWTIQPLDFRTIYIRCTSAATLTIPKNRVYQWRLWTSGTNAATISGDITGLTLDYLNVNGNNTLSGNISRNVDLTNLTITGSNTITGDITNMVYLETLLAQGSNILYGSIANLKFLTYIGLEGQNTVTGDISGLTRAYNISILGQNSVTGNINTLTAATYFYLSGQNTVSGDLKLISDGLTRCRLTTCRITEYTAGGNWSSINAGETIIVNPAVGYGLSSAEVDLLLQEIAATKTSGRLVNVTLKGSNAARTSASDAAFAILTGDGGTVLTN